MADPEGTIVCEFRNAYGEPISGDVRFVFTNQQVKSKNFEHETELTSGELRLNGVPAFPFGHWIVDINIRRFRSKRVFVDVPSNGETSIKEDFFVRPTEATPIFPSSDDIQNLPRWKPLKDVLSNSPIVYEKLDNQQKAGLLNLYAKMSHESAQRVFTAVKNVFAVKPARIYAEVEADLWDRVRALTDWFDEQHDQGSLHKFIEGWIRLDNHASFKTSEDMGNLQLTFAKKGTDRFAVDADLDDHQGIKHAFDVLKHTFSGDTNPYDIHDVLVRFHDIDPGYRLY